MLKSRAIIATSLSALTLWPCPCVLAQQSLAQQSVATQAGPTRINRPGHSPADAVSTSASGHNSGAHTNPNTNQPSPPPTTVAPSHGAIHGSSAAHTGAAAPAPTPKTGLVPLKPQFDSVMPPLPPDSKAPAPPPAFLNPPGGQSQPAVAPAPVRPRANVIDQYPAIGNLELVILGAADPASPIEKRLANLEGAVFNKTFSYDSLFDRTERLKKTILGAQEVDPNSAAARDIGGGTSGGAGSTNGAGWIDNPHPALESLSEVHYLDEQAALPENQLAVSASDLSAYAVMLINHERQSFGLAPLTSDVIAEKMAQEHTADQAKRSVLSHFSSKGDNPDRRLTLLEGTDCVTESIASVKVADVGVKRVCRAAVVRILKVLLMRQDDRDALLSADATHIGFAAAMAADGEKIISTAEVFTRRAIVVPTATEVTVGDKVEVKGVLYSPYYFDKVTLAWEAYSPDSTGGSTADDAEEALPYFPPLDYVAYANKAEHDYDKAMLALKTVGMVAAVAGGLFIPPVALAAPLIAVAGSGGEPKPVSDIPVKGGIKVDGAAFSGHIPLSNSNKEGLYYVTVWASLGRGQKSVAVSRRVILAKTSQEDAEEEKQKAAEKAREEQAKLDKENEKAMRKVQERHEKEARKAAEKARSKDKREKSLQVEGEVEPAPSANSAASKN